MSREKPTTRLHLLTPNMSKRLTRVPSKSLFLTTPKTHFTSPSQGFDTYEEFMCHKLQTYKNELEALHRKVKQAEHEVCFDYKYPMVTRSDSKDAFKIVYRSCGEGKRKRGMSLIPIVDKSKTLSGSKTLLGFHRREKTIEKLDPKRVTLGSFKIDTRSEIFRTMNGVMRCSESRKSFVDKRAECGGKKGKNMKIAAPKTLPSLQLRKTFMLKTTM
eukprot:TRINITY_DN11283_c0_g2_i3.p1 TRINITY_DN11283_c0_g2~~TRINITY_DN11283_c0_g2_i3.p1  ORF type:complete len:216 (+),score=33.30 TRINITY_DN11283_c0_g2_i3:91-738(+)